MNAKEDHQGFTFIHNRSLNMNYFLYTSHHSSLSSTTAVHTWIIIYMYIDAILLLMGRYELSKLTSLPMCGFIAQLEEQRRLTFIISPPLIYSKTAEIVSCTQVSHSRPWTEPALQHKHVSKWGRGSTWSLLVDYSLCSCSCFKNDIERF